MDNRELASAPVPAGDPHIVFEGLNKDYPGKHGPIAALREVSFNVARGEIFGIIGRSGAGKSTLLRTINVLERPSQGTVRIDGLDVGQLDENGLVALRRRVGMIFQHFNLLSAKTVAQNVGLPLRVAGVPRAETARRVRELLERVGLADKADAYPAQLSGGQKQRVGIARALAHQPEILLCDEATSALDPETTHAILALLRDINRELGLTVVLITHDMAVIREICQHVLVLDQGRIVEHGEVWRVFGAPSDAATQALLRPLQHAVPPDIAARLAPGLPDQTRDEAEVILSLRYTGTDCAHGLPLHLLAGLGPRARLLHGGLDRINGHAQGSLLVALPARDYQRDASLAARIADHIEVIGHVPASA